MTGMQPSTIGMALLVLGPAFAGFRAAGMDPTAAGLETWYLGMAAAQDAQTADARRYWSKLLTKIPPGSQDAKMIQSAVDALPQNRSGG